MSSAGGAVAGDAVRRNGTVIAQFGVREKQTMCEVCGDPMHKLDDDTEAATPRPPFDEETPEPPNTHDHTEP